MIVTRLTGGLGNQMFQYAAGRSLASRLDVPLVLDTRWINGAGGGLPGAVRRLELACFALEAERRDVTEVARLPPAGRVSFKLRHTFGRVRRPLLDVLFEADAPGIDARFFAAGDNTYLDGFWMSPQYFDGYERLLREDFVFTTPPSPRNARFAQQIAGTTSVSLHVRRGDSVSSPKTSAIKVHLDAAWYRRALSVVADQVGAITVFVFSDDHDWCRTELALDHPMVLVTGNGAETNYEDLRLMSQCRHHVIANSTFSWWGAWLDGRSDAIVVTPERWRRDRPTPARNLAGWIELPVQA